MLAAATGVTDGNDETQSRTYVPRCMIFGEHRRLALLDRALEHLRLERVDDREYELLARLGAQRRMRKPSNFCALSPTGAHDQNEERRQRDESDRREEDRKACEREGDPSA